MAGLKPRVWPNGGQGLEFKIWVVEWCIWLGVYFFEAVYVYFEQKTSGVIYIVAVELNMKVRSNFPGPRSSYVK